MSKLFSPIALRDLTLRNRIIVSPMCQYSAEDGRATAWHMQHLGSLALSGAAMLCVEATAVEADARISFGDLGLYDDATEAALVPVLAMIRKHSPIAMCIQLAHAGRKSSCKIPWDDGPNQLTLAQGGWTTSAPSALPYNADERPPVALDAAGLARIRDAFAAAAKRADKLGFEAIEIHGAHGYLLHEFMSPLSNQRTDAYGGSLENRIRFPLEVFDAIRAAFPTHKPVGFRVSATDWVDGGWDLPQTEQLANALTARGADWIDCSSGGLSPKQKIAAVPGYQVPFSEAIRKAGSRTMAVGLITDPHQAETILATEQADMITLARAMLYDPRWPWHAAAALGDTAIAPPQYLRSAPHEHAKLFAKPQ
jgi:NADPH2 dehydrogenase